MEFVKLHEPLDTLPPVDPSAPSAPRVIITGVTGQDGSNLVDYLLAETQCEVFGAVRRHAIHNMSNIQGAMGNPRFHLFCFDLQDSVSIEYAISKIQPAYFVNLAAQSFVAESWNLALSTFDTNCMGVLRVLEALRKLSPTCRFYSAGSSEEFGNVDYAPQDLAHPMRPRSPYGASKCAARHIVKVWRESYNMFAIHAILFNHEGPRRGQEFVTRKITRGLSEIKARLERDPMATVEPLYLGNIMAKRDWSDSEDFVRGIWMMLNQAEPKEYILSSDETHSVKEFIDLACVAAGFTHTVWYIDELSPEKTTLAAKVGEAEKGIVGRWVTLIRISEKYYRPAEVELLLGSSAEARKDLGWVPRTSFKQLVEKMVAHDLAEYRACA